MNSTIESARCLAVWNFSDSREISSTKYWSEIGLLAAFNIFVVIGNLVVLVALLIDRQLRTPTHYFIGSLAIADLALGLFVLPFATALHIRGFWIFGSLFCQIWLAFDVWLCTASIYSLIAVTFDRYVAVTKPLTYKLVMTRRKALMLIVVVWSAALVICLPAFAFSLKRTFRLSTVTCQCTQMAHTPVYIAYSSTGSFYLPMIVIIFLYARIYATVRKIRLSGSTGIVSMAKSAMANATSVRKTAPAVKACQHDTLSDRGPQYSGTLRVHKGRYQPAKCVAKKKGLVERLSAGRFHRFSLTKDRNGDKKGDNKQAAVVVVEEAQMNDMDEHSPMGTPKFMNQLINEDSDARYLSVSSAAPSGQSSVSNSPRGSMTEAKLIEQQINEAAAQTATATGATNPATAAADLWLHIIMPSQLTQIWCQRMAIFQKYQKKFALELRALKTVGIVTGCFLACWLGFCIVYTMQALPYCRNSVWETLTLDHGISFHTTGRPNGTVQTSTLYSILRVESCVPDWITDIMIWLGYVNSAMNPIIYGVSNKQFRRTFRRILRCDFSFTKNPRSRTKSDANRINRAL